MLAYWCQGSDVQTVAKNAASTHQSCKKQGGSSWSGTCLGHLYLHKRHTPLIVPLAATQAPCPVAVPLVSQEEFFLAFAKFEEIVKEYDRARAIYKYALDQLPRGAAQNLYETFNKFEKQHGSRYVLMFPCWFKSLLR